MSNCTTFSTRFTRSLMLALAGTLVLAAAQASMAQFRNSVVGGVMIDAHGVATRVAVEQQAAWATRMRQDMQAIAPELQSAVAMRRVSLRGLEAAIAAALAEGRGELPDVVRYLAGLRRVQFVLVYPEQDDIVLAGPGEAWTVNDRGDVVGVTSGQPVLRLDDLLVALRTVEAARTESISVSIDPTPEGVRRYEQLMKRQRTFNRSVIKAISEQMGQQKVTYTGIPTNTHFARVLMAADHQMKRLAMNLEKSPVRALPGFLDLLKAKRRLPGSAMPRWWMACDYGPLIRSKDRLVWELRSPGVKVMTEDEHIAADGTFQGTGQVDPIAKQWADGMTEHYQELAERETVFAELRNLMDLCVVAALIEKEDLMGLAGVSGFPLLCGQQSRLAMEEWGSPQTVPTICSYLKIGRNYVITASGGVQIDSWQVASNVAVETGLDRIRSKAADGVDDRWWN